MKEKINPTSCMVLCSVLWSLSCVLVSLIPWNPFVISSLRSALAALVMWLYVRRCGYRFKISRTSFLGACAIVLMCSSYIWALRHTTSASAITLQFTSPLFILLIDYFFNRKPIIVSDLIAVLITMLGVAIIFFDGFTRQHLWGNISALAAGLFSACMYLALGNDNSETKSSTILLGHLLCFFVGIPFLFFSPPALTSTSLFCIVVLGIFQLGIPYVLLLKASGACPPLLCALISAIEPMLAPFWVFAVSGEVPQPRVLIGSAIIIVSVTVWNFFRSRPSK